MVKITVSYENPNELQKVIKLLGSTYKTCRVPRVKKGPFNKAYIELNNQISLVN